MVTFHTIEKNPNPFSATSPDRLIPTPDNRLKVLSW